MPRRIHQPTETYDLLDENGPPYTDSEVNRIMHWRDPGTLSRKRKQGTAPPFFRSGKKHSRCLTDRREFWRWFRENSYRNEAEAEESQRLRAVEEG